MVRSLRLAAAALVLGATAFGATAASAHGFGAGFGNFHTGFHGVGIRLGGWGYRHIGYRPAFGGCYVQRYVDVYGDVGFQRICY